MRVFAGVLGVYLFVAMTWAGRALVVITIGMPFAVEFHQRGMARVRAYERRRSS